MGIIVQCPLLIRTIIKRSTGHVCTTLTVHHVHKFIIILALLSQLALGAEFNLIGDLHKVITICRFLKQWWSWCPVGLYFLRSLFLCLSITHQQHRFTLLVFHMKNKPPSALYLSLSFGLYWRLCYSLLISVAWPQYAVNDNIVHDVLISAATVWINSPHCMLYMLLYLSLMIFIIIIMYCK